MSGQAFSWIGGSGVAWNNAANWQDLTLGGAAVLAPGALDSVSIVGNATPLVVTGTGMAAAAATHLSVLLDGAFQFGTIDVEGTLTLAGAGTTLALGSLGEAGAAGPSLLVAHATRLSVAANAVLGSASISDGGWVQLGHTASITDGLAIDGASCVEVGSGGIFWPSWLKVYADGLLAGSGVVAANAVIDGTVNAAGLAFDGLLGGSGQVRLLNGGASVGTVFPGMNLVFAAQGACLTIAAGAATSMAGTLVGFAAGDAIDLQGITGATAQFAASDASHGVITVSDGRGSAIAHFAVTGDAAALSASRFLAVPDDAAGTLLVDLTAAPAGASSPGNTTPHHDSWIGGSGVAWNNAANWQDLTLGGAAVLAPGALDSVSIVGNATPLVVTGTGIAAAAATHLSVLLDGAFQFGTIDVEGTLTLAGAGTTLALGSLGEAGAAGPSLLVAHATRLSVAANAVLGSASISDGGWVQLGHTASITDGLAIDGASCVEVGSGGIFWPSWLKVYADGLLAGSGVVAANAVIDGTVNAAGLAFDGLLGGSGQVRLLNGGASVGTVFPGMNLVFAAQGACLTIAAGAAASMAGTLVGFAAGDAIDLQGITGATAQFAASDASHGVITVSDGRGSAIAHFAVTGDAAALSASRFLAVPDDAAGTLLVDLTAAPAGASSPGNTTPHHDSWIGGSGVAWNNAANWQDLTLGGAAVLAPGALDSVSIVGNATPLVVTGTGIAAAAATHLSVLLDGAFQFGTIDVEGTLTLAGAGTTLALGSLGEAGAAGPSLLVAHATRLSVAANAVLGSASISDGGWVQLGHTASITDGLAIDGASCVEVGSGGIFWPSWLKVYADGLLAGSGVVAANAVIDGTVNAAGLAFDGLLGGSGQVRLLNGGASVGTVFPGMNLVFAAQGACLTIAAGAAASMAGTLVGFAAGDAIDLQGITGATAQFAASDASHGVITVSDGAGQVIATLRTGSDATGLALASFLSVSDGAGGTLLIDLAPATDVPVDPGNPAPHSYSWIGGSAAAWNDAGSWRDLTLAAAAPIAPGSLDTVSIIGTALPLIVTGSGAAAAVATQASVLLDGVFAFGTLDVSGTLTLAGAGSRLDVAALGQAGASQPSLLIASGTHLTVTDHSDLGRAQVSAGAWVRLGGSAGLAGTLSIDPSSCVEVGAGGTFWPSWLKVYADATLSGSGLIAANTVVEGTIDAAGLQFGGFLGGSGQVRLGSGGASVGTVFPGVQLVFADPGVTLAVASGSLTSMSGTLVGFAAGDAIDLRGQVATAARFAATDAGHGMLAVTNATGATLGVLSMAGNSAAYAGGGFAVRADGAGGSLIAEVAGSGVLAFTHPS